MPQDSSETQYIHDTILTTDGYIIIEHTANDTSTFNRDSLIYEILKESNKYTTTNRNNEDAFLTLGIIMILTLAVAFIFLIIIKLYNRFHQGTDSYQSQYSDNKSENNISSPLVYTGRDLKFSDEELTHICKKYNLYFNKLTHPEQFKFIGRLKEFIRSKDFYINSEKGYKEMPVLISAAAIQITFGLDEFTLPHFRNIIVQPDAYVAVNPLRILMGNVQGRNITLSWKHFLEDYQQPTDGKNVGLHEMAHALQVQYLFSGKENEFSEDFTNYDLADDKVLKLEYDKSGLFEQHVLKNKNELWATSVELFFERPEELKASYPELYQGLKTVLNQDPLRLS